MRHDLPPSVEVQTALIPESSCSLGPVEVSVSRKEAAVAKQKPCASFHWMVEIPKANLNPTVSANFLQSSL